MLHCNMKLVWQRRYAWTAAIRLCVAIGHHNHSFHVVPVAAVTPYAIFTALLSGRGQRLLWPALERGAPGIRQQIDAALGTIEPAIHIVL
jgi:hypothetical protein